MAQRLLGDRDVEDDRVADGRKDVEIPYIFIAKTYHNRHSTLS